MRTALAILLAACTPAPDGDTALLVGPEPVTLTVDVPAGERVAVAFGEGAAIKVAMTLFERDWNTRGDLVVVNTSSSDRTLALRLTSRTSREVQPVLTPSPLDAPCVQCRSLEPLPWDAGEGYFPISPRAYHHGLSELNRGIALAARRVTEQHPEAGPFIVADLSQADGEIPGTDDGVPRHPAPSHRDGFSADLGYFVTEGDPLDGEPACPSADRTFCDGPHHVDVAPTVTLFAGLVEHLILTQIIVDPVMETDFRAEIATRDDLPPAVRDDLSRILTSGQPFHADHFHIAVARRCFNGLDDDGDGTIDQADPDCEDFLDDTEE